MAFNSECDICYHLPRYKFKIFCNSIIACRNRKVSTKSVPFLSQFFLKKVSEKSQAENAALIHFPPVITTLLLRKNFKTSCNYNCIIVVVSFLGQRLFFWKNIFSSVFQSRESEIFCQGVWVLPTSFLRLSALTIFGEKWGVYRQTLCLLSTKLQKA